MTENDQPKSLEKRIAACPIHQWADIGDYLERAGVPNDLWEPFHELVIARGQYPKNMSQEHGKKFGQEAVLITHRYFIEPMEAHSLRIIFGQLIEQWLGENAINN